MSDNTNQITCTRAEYRRLRPRPCPDCGRQMWPKWASIGGMSDTFNVQGIATWSCRNDLCDNCNAF